MLTALVSTGGRETLQSSCRIREVTGRKGVGQAGAPLERRAWYGTAPHLEDADFLTFWGRHVAHEGILLSPLDWVTLKAMGVEWGPGHRKFYGRSRVCCKASTQMILYMDVLVTGKGNIGSLWQAPGRKGRMIALGALASHWVMKRTERLAHIPMTLRGKPSIIIQALSGLPCNVEEVHPGPGRSTGWSRGQEGLPNTHPGLLFPSWVACTSLMSTAAAAWGVLCDHLLEDEGHHFDGPGISVCQCWLSSCKS
jgi:hypothetical protein